MDKLKKLFDYQRFANNKKLKSKIDDVYSRYFDDCEEISEDEADIYAAGDVHSFLSDNSERKKR